MHDIVISYILSWYNILLPNYYVIYLFNFLPIHLVALPWSQVCYIIILLLHIQSHQQTQLKCNQDVLLEFLPCNFKMVLSQFFAIIRSQSQSIWDKLKAFLEIIVFLEFGKFETHRIACPQITVFGHSVSLLTLF